MAKFLSNQIKIHDPQIFYKIFLWKTWENCHFVACAIMTKHKFYEVLYHSTHMIVSISSMYSYRVTCDAMLNAQQVYIWCQLPCRFDVLRVSIAVSFHVRRKSYVYAIMVIVFIHVWLIRNWYWLDECFLLLNFRHCFNLGVGNNRTSDCESRFDQHFIILHHRANKRYLQNAYCWWRWNFDCWCDIRYQYHIPLSQHFCNALEVNFADLYKILI